MKVVVVALHEVLNRVVQRQGIRHKTSHTSTLADGRRSQKEQGLSEELDRRKTSCRRSGGNREAWLLVLKSPFFGWKKTADWSVSSCPYLKYFTAHISKWSLTDGVFLASIWNGVKQLCIVWRATKTNTTVLCFFAVGQNETILRKNVFPKHP